MTKCKHCGKKIIRDVDGGWIHHNDGYERCDLEPKAEPSEEEKR